MMSVPLTLYVHYLSYPSTLQKVTRMMLILSPRHHATINIDNIELKDDIKYLGVYIDNHLNWQP